MHEAGGSAAPIVDRREGRAGEGRTKERAVTAWPMSRSSAPSGATRARARSSIGCRERADVVVRFQGGHNAGHTLVIGNAHLQAQPAALGRGAAGQARRHRQRRGGRSLGACRGDRDGPRAGRRGHARELSIVAERRR